MYEYVHMSDSGNISEARRLFHDPSGLSSIVITLGRLSNSLYILARLSTNFIFSKYLQKVPTSNLTFGLDAISDQLPPPGPPCNRFLIE